MLNSCSDFYSKNNQYENILIIQTGGISMRLEKVQEALKTKNIENQKIRDIAATLSKCALPQTIYIINEHPYKLEKSGILRKGQANQ